MGYIIVAEFAEDRYPEAAQKLLREPLIRTLSRNLDESTVQLDIRGDFERAAEQTQWLSEKLIGVGVLNFSIHHSY